jgi:hypothetical protein
MIRQGLELLIQSGLAAQNPPVVVPGGFLVTLPKDTISETVPAAWCFRSLQSSPSFNLQNQSSWTKMIWRINCHGFQPANAVSLALAIQTVLRGGFSGTLPDPDNTEVFLLTETDESGVEGYSDTDRSWVTTLEYEIQYNQI